MDSKSTQTKRKSISEKIFLTTERLLKTEGFEALSIRNVCAKAGVAYSSFYYNFQDKADLLYQYGRRIFEEKLTRTQRPEYAYNGNYAKYISWLFRVYAEFCEEMGCEFIKDLYETSTSDIFYDVCFKTLVVPIMEEAVNNKYIRFPKDELHYILEDIEPIYKGVIHFWSMKAMQPKEVQTESQKWWQEPYRFAASEKQEELSLADLIERIMFRFFRSVDTAKFRKAFPSKIDMEYDLETEE